MMQKRSKVEVEGYVHEVSPVLEGGNHSKYFTAILQEAERNSRVVVFDVHRRNVFESAEKDRTPVRLCDVVLSPSRQRSGHMDVIVNTRSALTCVRQLNFAFDGSCHDHVEDMTLLKILEQPREYQRVNVTVNVVNQTEHKQGVTRSGQKMTSRAYDVADHSSSMSLTVWGSDVLEIGQWYHITNVSVRQFGGFCLTTTPQSTVSVLPNYSSDVAAVRQHFDTKEGEIITAEVKVDYLCPKQHSLRTVNKSTLLTRCEICSAYCRTEKVTSVLRASISIEDSTGTISSYVLDDFVFRQLVKIPCSVNMEPDVLVGKLLNEEQSRLQIKYRGSRVISAVFVSKVEMVGNCAQSEEQQSSASSCTMSECAENICDGAVLKQLFAEVVPVVSETQNCEEVDKGCVSRINEKCVTGCEVSQSTESETDDSQFSKCKVKVKSTAKRGSHK